MKAWISLVLVVSALAILPGPAAAATVNWGSADPSFSYHLWGLGGYKSATGQTYQSYYPAGGSGWYGSIYNPNPDSKKYAGAFACLGADHPNLYGKGVSCTDVPTGVRNNNMFPAKSFIRNWYVDLALTIHDGGYWDDNGGDKPEINFGFWVWAEHDNLGCTPGGGGCISRIELMNYVLWWGYLSVVPPGAVLPPQFPGIQDIGYLDRNGDGVKDYFRQAYFVVPPSFPSPLLAGKSYVFSPTLLNLHLPAEIVAEPEHWKITWFGFYIEGSDAWGSATVNRLQLYSDPDPAPANPTLSLLSGSTAVTATWTWPYSSTFYAYRLTLCKDSSCVSRITEWGTTNPSVLDHTFSGLSPSTSYYIRMEVLDDVLNTATLPIQGIATKASTGGGGGGGGRFI